MKQLRWCDRENFLPSQKYSDKWVATLIWWGRVRGAQDKLWEAWAQMTMLLWTVCPWSRLFKNLTGSLMNGQNLWYLGTCVDLQLCLMFYHTVVMCSKCHINTLFLNMSGICFHSVHMFKSEDCSAALSVLPYLVPQEHLKKIFSNISSADGEKDKNSWNKPRLKRGRKMTSRSHVSEMYLFKWKVYTGS